MTGLVFDANATLALILDEQPDAAKATQYAAEYALVAPWLWRLEVTNTLVVKERRKLLTSEIVSAHLRRIDAFPIELVPPEATLRAVNLGELARPHQLTAHDAVYLDLAIRRSLPLCTFDRNLRLAAERAGVTVVG
jgi:predicted nucleic acid-binding protein